MYSQYSCVHSVSHEQYSPFLLPPLGQGEHSLTLGEPPAPAVTQVPLSNCMQSDVMTVLFSLSTFLIKITYLLTLYSGLSWSWDKVFKVLRP